MIRTFCRFGLNRRLVATIEWLRLCPNAGPLWQEWQTLAMAPEYRSDPRGTLGRDGAGRLHHRWADAPGPVPGGAPPGPGRDGLGVGGRGRAAPPPGCGQGPRRAP